MQRRIRVALDAMGGDFAPAETVKGAVQAARDGDVEIILVGHLDAISRELDKHDTTGLPIHTFHAEESIPDGGNPMAAIREKKQASILVANRLVKEGWADGVVSAGHSGASLLASSIVLGRIEGVDRPAAGLCFPFAPHTFVVDLGANTNSTPEHLFQFAVIGAVFVQAILGIPNPTVALLSNGEEEGKGNRVVKQAYQLLKDSDLNFVGNVEGHDIVFGKVNVVVCDGLTGNIILKYTEGLSRYVLRALEEQLGEQFAAVGDKPIVEELRILSEITQDYGMPIILGVDGVSIIIHGRSTAEMVVGGIRHVRSAVQQRMVERLKRALAQEMARVKDSLLVAGA